MANSLKSTLDSLAQTFAANVLAAIRGASLQELLSEAGGGAGAGRGRRTRSARRAARASAGVHAAAPAVSGGRRGGRLARRSPADIAGVLGKVVTLLKGKKDGLRSEEIQRALRLDKRELPRVLKTGLGGKKLRSKGQKRATRYFAA